MKLELFKFDTCPYCRKVMRYIEDSDHTDIIYRDIHKEPENLERLVQIGGKKQVPCLFIDGKPMYESDDIIAWLKENNGMKEIYLAGGCFWGLQKFFDQFPGVIETEVGYANGPEADITPDYQAVCNNIGHAETVRIVYDENRLSLERLLDYYFMVIDPVSVNRQGNDIGIQYRTGIYYPDNEQLEIIRRVYEREQKKVDMPMAVEVESIRNFYSAEEYHQKYLDKNPSGYCHIPRKMFEIAGKGNETGNN